MFAQRIVGCWASSRKVMYSLKQGEECLDSAFKAGRYDSGGLSITVKDLP